MNGCCGFMCTCLDTRTLAINMTRVQFCSTPLSVLNYTIPPLTNFDLRVTLRNIRLTRYAKVVEDLLLSLVLMYSASFVVTRSRAPILPRAPTLLECLGPIEPSPSHKLSQKKADGATLGLAFDRPPSGARHRTPLLSSFSGRTLDDPQQETLLFDGAIRARKRGERCLIYWAHESEIAFEAPTSIFLLSSLDASA